MTGLARWFAVKRYRFAYFRYWMRYPSMAGNPMLGKTREQRPPGTAPTKEKEIEQRDRK